MELLARTCPKTPLESVRSRLSGSLLAEMTVSNRHNFSCGVGDDCDLAHVIIYLSARNVFRG